MIVLHKKVANTRYKIEIRQPPPSEERDVAPW